MSADDSQPGVRQLRAWAASALERGRAAWPDLAVSEAELARAAALRLSGAARAGSPDDLDAPELYLAAACMRGDAAATAQLRARYFDPLAPALRRMGLDVAQRDDIWQTLCKRLLVGAEGELPRIARYAGAGALTGFIRVAATRLALNWLEQENRRAGGESWIDQLPSGHADPELHAMKQQHRVELKEELAAAVEALSSRERMVLRMHLVERLGIDAIAGLCSIHRATAARLIARAKETLTDQVRARLVARWNVADNDLAAVKTLVDSQVDLSLERLLAGD